MANDTDNTTQTGNFYSQSGKYVFKSAAATSAANITDSNGNELTAFGASTFSTLTATNHNYGGAITPAFAYCQENNGASAAAAAAAMSLGTFSTTQYTPAGTANRCTVLVSD